MAIVPLLLFQLLLKLLLQTQRSSACRKQMSRVIWEEMYGDLGRMIRRGFSDHFKLSRLENTCRSLIIKHQR